MDHFKLNTSPSADPQAVFTFGNARFSVLTDRIIRCEFDDQAIFRDEPTQTFLNRKQPVPNIQKNVDKKTLCLKTEFLTLTYHSDKGPFAPDSLSVSLNNTDTEWRFGDADTENLRGTFRTLDCCSGNLKTDKRGMKRIDLSNGLISRSGWAVIDDSGQPVFNQNGFLENAPNMGKDLYFFGYGTDFKSCIRDYYKISGPPAMIPKWALGIWWSRWQKYAQSDLEQIVAEFRENDIPLSVCVIDMDWHIVDNPYHRGWTGYSWNNELFPEPQKFLKDLHNQDIHACLNLHPDGGVHPHEDAYNPMAKHCGIDPESKSPVPFDITDPTFIEAYFKYLHHPLENDGVDFFWIDWQQGTNTGLEGVDPLWYLNHLHSLDIARNGNKRPFVFSRWADKGAHRYPIGFSGDAYCDWQTLQYEVYSTANAANIGYGWWSHDIGGFARGYNDDERYVRWTQFGCWSPIFRYHNFGSPNMDYRPWTKSPEIRDAALTALKQRRKLIPYIYTAAWKNHNGERTLVAPLYHEYSEDDKAYQFPNQYCFGESLIVAPFTTPADPSVRLARKTVYLPEGTWFDFQTGARYNGKSIHAVYGDLNTVPVFATAGSVIPHNSKTADYDLLVFPGNKTSFLYEDDGVTMDYTSGNFRELSIEQTFDGTSCKLTININSGRISKKSKFNIILRGFISENIQCKDCSISTEGDDFHLKGIEFNGEETTVTITFNSSVKHKPSFTFEQFEKLMKQQLMLPNHLGKGFFRNLSSFYDDPRKLGPYLIEFTEQQIRCICELLLGTGFEVVKLFNDNYIIHSWNNTSQDDFRVHISRRLFASYKEIILDGKTNDTALLEQKDVWHSWMLRADFIGLTTIKQTDNNPVFAVHGQ